MTPLLLALVLTPHALAGERCGPTRCGEGQVCCNASCGICAEPDGACIQPYCGWEPRGPDAQEPLFPMAALRPTSAAEADFRLAVGALGEGTILDARLHGRLPLTSSLLLEGSLVHLGTATPSSGDRVGQVEAGLALTPPSGSLDVRYGLHLGGILRGAAPTGGGGLASSLGPAVSEGELRGELAAGLSLMGRIPSWTGFHHLTSSVRLRALPAAEGLVLGHELTLGLAGGLYRHRPGWALAAEVLRAPGEATLLRVPITAYVALQEGAFLGIEGGPLVVTGPDDASVGGFVGLRSDGFDAGGRAASPAR